MHIHRILTVALFSYAVVVIVFIVSVVQWWSYSTFCVCLQLGYLVNPIHNGLT